ncbi:MAG: C10 family peptidase [Bacteroidetes bacterium]|nr:C10 family peptidase [Bacteroidota bacterium]
MLKKSVFFLLAFLPVTCLLARQVPVSDAKKAALSFYYERANQYKSIPFSDVQIRETFSVKEKDEPLYYTFNLEPSGYVIVSADDAVPPVLAYSFEGAYSEENQPPQFTSWMRQYARQISFARESNALPSQEAILQWNHLLNTPAASLGTFKGQRDVEPMITSNWNQPYPYNEMCPADPAGSNGHAIAGCVPVCMAQIMYYYRWPDHGTGSYTYYDQTYGLQHASFDSTWYRWENMKNMVTTSDPGIAQLIYHLGVSVDLVYGAQSSGMYNHKAAYSLRTYFKYSPETRYVFRDSTTMNWDSLIIAHLDRKMPLYYAGWSVPNINGHAFVCDGYQGSDYFHFNFGWAGSFNGYFYTDNLTPGGNNFNLAQELIINCYPDTINYSYPSYCSGAKTVAYDQGSLTDGSSPTRNYHTGADCSWLIDPQTSTDSVSKVNLTFDRFEISPGDTVRIYDGPAVNSPLLGSFSGNTLPATISSTGNKMLVTFKSESGNPSEGWSANYSTTIPVWCSGQKTITADTAEITDGSFRFNYHNNQLCRWMITPASQIKPLKVYFRSFDTEQVKDVVKILDPESHDTLAIISGHYSSPNLPDSVTSPSGKMYIIFSSNSNTTADGWELYYPRSSSGIIEKSGFPGLKIFPNPASSRVNIEFGLQEETTVELRLSSMQGQTIMMKNADCKLGKNELFLDVTDVAPGIYLIGIANTNTTETHKIIITKR